jgi:hypothetical protein
VVAVVLDPVTTPTQVVGKLEVRAVQYQRVVMVVAEVTVEAVVVVLQLLAQMVLLDSIRLVALEALVYHIHSLV